MRTAQPALPLIVVNDPTQRQPPSPDPAAELVRLIDAHSPCVVLLLGAPGAGKSTLAATLVHRMGNHVAVLSYAAHRAEVGNGPADVAADPTAGALLQSRLADRCAAALTTIVDGTHHLARTRDALLRIAAAAGRPAIAAVLSTPLTVSIARQQDRPPAAPGAQHGLRVPEPQMRNINHEIEKALPALAREGFIVHVLPAATTS